MRKVTKCLTVVLGLVVIFMTNQSGVMAKAKRVEARKDQTTPVTVQVLPELPKDNIGGNHLGYYVLPMNNHRTRLETFKLFNPTNQDLKISFRVVDATTNDNGTVDYTGQNKIDTKILKQPGSKLIKTPKTLILAPNELKDVSFKINKIASNFKGQKATAINVLASGINSRKSSIQNQYNYAIGVILQGETLPKKELEKLKFSGIKVRLTNNQKPAISVQLINPDATYLKNTKLKISLVNGKYSFFNYKSTQKELKVAPNSKFYEDILLGGKRLVPGIYKLNMTAISDQYQQTTSRYVKITKTQAQFINMNNYQYLKQKKRLIEIGIIVLVTILVGLLFYWIKVRRKDNLK
ncbi:DUF3324 domain-containing protein [Lactobacillus curvatus]|nr:DUF3324 domain-containing protein [Latilactobacillus curvatus]MSE24208.1 DUF3324 domain-containing protein [Latilactobacillus curvatus]